MSVLLHPASVSWCPPPAAGGPTGVEAGTLLGVGGGDAAGCADEGAVAIPRRDGRVEIRAARDGHPAHDGERVGVEPLRALEAHVGRASGDHSVHGALTVNGQIAPGRSVEATAGLRVSGNVDRALVAAGGALVLEGRVSGSHLLGGAIVAARRRLARPLAGVGAQIDELVEAVRMLTTAGRQRGRAVPDAWAIRTLAASRFGAAAERLARADALAAAAGRERGPRGLTEAVRRALRAIEDPERVPDPLSVLDEAAGFLAAAVPGTRPPAAPRAMIAAATSCAIDAAGSLWFTGAGAADCDVTVAGDLFATGAGGGLRASRAVVGGRVRAGELAGRDTRPLELTLEASGTDDDLLRAEVVQAGVVIVAGGERIRIDRRRTDVRLSLLGGSPRLASS